MLDRVCSAESCRVRCTIAVILHNVRSKFFISVPELLLGVPASLMPENRGSAAFWHGCRRMNGPASWTPKSEKLFLGILSNLQACVAHRATLGVHSESESDF